jgi:radical SAM enzyme (TIGR01210 family)
MNEIAQFCKDLKKDIRIKVKNPKKPVSYWSEKDILNSKIIDTFVIIFRTKGCSWALKSGCSMCGYFNDSMLEEVSDEDIFTQFERAMKNYSSQKFVKIFTSGSFLDDKEISSKIRKKILNKLYETAGKVTVESRPEYITEKKLSEIKKIVKDKIFEIGIGLETASDEVRKKYLNKGFTFKDYKESAKLLKKYNFNLKTYVLIKPPFLTEKESIDDAIITVEKIKDVTDIISFNPTNVQKNTLVEFLWKRKEYRPPYLFSIVKILKESKKIAKKTQIKCDISGGGSNRGPHNCKSCDKKYLNAIADFSLNQDEKIFEGLSCDCKEKWLDLLDIEDLSFGSIIDI